MRTDVIFFSGMASSGKSSLAKLTAKHYNYKFYDGGSILKEMAKEQGYVVTKDFWDTDSGMEFLRKRDEDPNFDKKLDKKLIELANKGKAVFTTWTLPWLYQGEAISIWFDASQKVRAERMTERDKITVRKALEVIKQRDKKNKALYKKLYGIELEKDLTVFDFVVNTDGIPIPPLFKLLKCYLDMLKKLK